MYWLAKQNTTPALIMNCMNMLLYSMILKLNYKFATKSAIILQNMLKRCCTIIFIAHVHTAIVSDAALPKQLCTSSPKCQCMVIIHQMIH